MSELNAKIIEVTLLRERVTQLRTENDALERANARLIAERDELDAATREHHEAALEKLEGRVTHWMGQRDKFCDQLADEKKSHARTQEWLDKFQSEAATQQVRGIMAEQALAKAEAERDALRARAERAEAALPDPGKLWSLATWMDSIYPYDSNPEVQTDLRTWARQIFAIGLHNDSWAVEVEVSAALAAASEDGGA